ncbi:MAG: DUF11 domain-containing protein [Chloroflexi bacterium]|nr:DUF11 domain-containing protein [Chloroflexota bacterium]
MKMFWKFLLGTTMLSLVGLLILALPMNSRVDGRGRAPIGSSPNQTTTQTDAEPVITGPYESVLSPAVSDISPGTPGDVTLDTEVIPRFNLNASTTIFNDPNWRDPLVQNPLSNPQSTPPLLFGFEGIPRTVGGATPPDVIGAVGPNHYVQMVNATWFAIYDKTGGVIQAPTRLNTLWAGQTNGCQTSNAGDPVVTYDWYEDRWIMAQFGSGNSICVAVSASGNPGGTYHTYRFTYSGFPDYFKIGVWPDAYYVGANQSGQNVHALQKSAMLTGAAANMISFSQASVGNHSFLLPSTLEGYTQPPAGAPNVFHRFIDGDISGGVDRIELFEFHVDWTTPGNSTWTGPIQLPSAPFASLCNFSFSCIRQPGTAQRIDSITEWPMWRFQYRNFGGHQTLVSTHAVNVGSDQSGIRWFELRKVGAGAWTIHQESTFAPDGESRWMASAAMDGDGNLALGYSVSSTSVFPSLRYTIRLASDPTNTLQAEENLIAGGGSQTGTNRWGDYSALTVDPADDCTFWYTGEYYSTTSSNNWQTRIGVFRIPGCGGDNADMAIDKAAATSPVTVGDPITYTLTITNNGSVTATNVLVTDTLPAEVTFVSATASQGSCGEVSGVVQCSLGTLFDQASATVTLVVTANQAGDVLNTAQVASDLADPNSTNNSSSATVTVEEPVNTQQFIFLPLIAAEP